MKKLDFIAALEVVFALSFAFRCDVRLMWIGKCCISSIRCIYAMLSNLCVALVHMHTPFFTSFF